MGGNVGAALLAAVVALAQATQQPARDVRPAPPRGTSTIHGRVVSTDVPPVGVRRARVIVTSSTGEITRSVITDDDGRFTVAGLPTARYSIAASKPGSIRASFGALRPGRAGTQITIAAGQTSPDLTLTMAKGGVITGIVTDEAGRPAAGVIMRILQFRYENGTRVLNNIALSPGTTGEVTDDRGQYRFFGLTPGDYVVAAVPPDVNATAIRTAAGTNVGYVPVFFPGTTISDDAQTIAAKAGEETAGINLRLQYVRTAKISGAIVLPPAMQQKDVQITLMPEVTAPVSVGSTAAVNLVASLKMLAALLPDNSFSFSNIAPGKYTVRARAFERPTALSLLDPGTSYAAALNRIPSYWAQAEVMVDGNDVNGLALTLQPGLTVSGKVQLRASSATSVMPDLTKIRVTLEELVRMGGISFGTSNTDVTAAGTFTLKGVVPGRYRLRAYASGGPASGNWSVKSAIVKGQDTIDFPVEILATDAITDVVVTMGDATQRVSGVLQDATGRPATDYTVIVFPADRALWTIGRRIRTAKPGVDGRYTFSDLLAGDYRLAAVVDIGPGEQNDPAVLEVLLPASIPVPLKDGERRVQDIRIGGF